MKITFPSVFVLLKFHRRRLRRGIFTALVCVLFLSVSCATKNVEQFDAPKQIDTPQKTEKIISEEKPERVEIPGEKRIAQSDVGLRFRRPR